MKSKNDKNKLTEKYTFRFHIWNYMNISLFTVCKVQEKFEDIKGEIKNRKSTKDRQYNGQKKER